MEVAVVIRLPAQPLLLPALGGWSGDFNLEGHRGSLHVPRFHDDRELAAPDAIPIEVANGHEWGEPCLSGLRETSAVAVAPYRARSDHVAA